MSIVNVWHLIFEANLMNHLPDLWLEIEFNPVGNREMSVYFVYYDINVLHYHISCFGK